MQRSHNKMSRKLGHSFGPLSLARGDQYCNADREVMNSDREVTKAQVLREVTKAVHLFLRHFWLSWTGGAELGKKSFTIEFVYENYNF